MVSRPSPRKSRPAAKAKLTVKPPVKAAAGRKTPARDDQRYHHGSLDQALLQAAETVLERDGLQGLTLRAVAREAGVSHAAPTHHFGDLTGLLSELAAIGFQRFGRTMGEAGAIHGTPGEKAMARARAYVAYAKAKPGMYGLMFRTERLDMNRPALHAAANASFAGLMRAIGAKRQEEIADDHLSMDQATDIVRAWSLVHGYTMLMLDGRLKDVLERLPAGTDAETLLVAMLKSTVPQG